MNKNKFNLYKNSNIYKKAGSLARIINVIFILSTAVFISSCFPVRNIAQDEKLLLSNKFKFESGEFKNNEVDNYYVQRPNQKLLLMRLYLRSYNFGTRFQDSNFIHKIFADNIGEPPVILDSTKLEKTNDNIEKYLFNNGYYNAEVRYKIIPKGLKKKAAKVIYYIDAGEVYTINEVKIECKQRGIKTFVQADFYNSYLKKGDRYSLDNLKDERDRISLKLNNNAYYYFNKSMVTYDIDTNLAGNKIDIVTKINTSVKRSINDTIQIPLKRYKINNVFIHEDINQASTNKKPDTLFYYYEDNRANKTFLYHIIHYGDIVIKPKAIIRSLYIKPGNYYKKFDVRKSYSLLSQMNNYDLIEIQMLDLKTNEDVGKLNCVIKLSRKDRIHYGANSEVNNTGGDLGLEQSFNISHSNFLKKAEMFKLSVYGAMEMRSVVNNETSSNFIGKFNTFEAGTNMSIEMPRFLMPANQLIFPKYFNPNTSIKMGYNWQNRPDFKRNILNMKLGYNWSPFKTQFHNFELIELSAVRINTTNDFQAEIDALNDPRLKYSYQNHLISSMSYRYIFKGEQRSKFKPFFLFSTFLEAGGLLVDLTHKAIDGEVDNDGQRILFNIPYAQFAKAEFDFRYYQPGGEEILNVLRVYAGIGIPYNNSRALPFEKSFYIGGANSLRAYPLGFIGLGTHNDPGQLFEKTGDIKLEANYELRFPLGKSLKAAIFTDAGNIWLIEKSNNFTGGKFEFDKFYKQFYLDIGYGLRYDLEFLIIRIDLAHPVYQPYYSQGERWTMKGLDNKLITGFNFAIGYPF